jgi:mannosyl-oligosaccharide alpha-1,2-mannosidase
MKMKRVRRHPVSYRFRHLLAISVAIIYLLYITLPDFADGGSSFDVSSGSRVSIFGYRGDKGRVNYGRPVQFDFGAHTRRAGDPRKAEEVKETMRRTFWKYRLGAWGSDEIKPISGDGKTTR